MGSVPLGGGVSSSASVEVLVMLEMGVMWVAGGYRCLCVFTGGYGGYRRLQGYGVTGGYLWLRVVTGGYMCL